MKKAGRFLVLIGVLRTPVIGVLGGGGAASPTETDENIKRKTVTDRIGTQICTYIFLVNYYCNVIFSSLVNEINIIDKMSKDFKLPFIVEVYTVL